MQNYIRGRGGIAILVALILGPGDGTPRPLATSGFDLTRDHALHPAACYFRYWPVILVSQGVIQKFQRLQDGALAPGDQL